MLSETNFAYLDFFDELLDEHEVDRSSNMDDKSHNILQMLRREYHLDGTHIHPR